MVLRALRPKRGICSRAVGLTIVMVRRETGINDAEKPNG